MWFFPSKFVVYIFVEVDTIDYTHATASYQFLYWLCSATFHLITILGYIANRHIKVNKSIFDEFFLRLTQNITVAGDERKRSAIEKKMGTRFSISLDLIYQVKLRVNSNRFFYLNLSKEQRYCWARKHFGNMIDALIDNPNSVWLYTWFQSRIKCIVYSM